MEFEWYANKATANLQKHGISFGEAATVFGDLLSVTFPDPNHSINESRFITIGLSNTGKIIILSILIEVRASESLVLEKQLVRNRGFMKKDINQEMDDELRPEYDLAQLQGGVEGKYAELYRQGTNLVLLEPDVAKAFPTAQSVNEALRLLMKLAKSQVEG